MVPLKKEKQMILTIDVGNSHTVFGVFLHKQLRCHWRIKTESSRTTDELASLCHTLFVMDNIVFTEITGIIIASVVPSAELTWTQFAKRYLQIIPILVNHRLKTGLKIITDNPTEVGADRIVNSAAAYAQYRSALLIVDCGTAITLDCVSTKGEYLGGVIAPGIVIALNALTNKTAQLPKVDLSCPPPTPIGTNTVDAIKSGILYGYGGLIDTLIKRLMQQFKPESPKIIATGGMAELISPYTEYISTIDPILTMSGLYLLYESNKPPYPARTT